MTRAMISKFATVPLMALALFVSPAQASDYEAPINGVQTISDFRQFVPQPSRKTRLDYGLLDEALSYVVVDLGPSLRTRMQKPQAKTGSRFITGHTSPYRMEGVRVTFDYITEDFLQGLTEYRKDLEEIGTKVNISTLSRNEQLSYWFNLHNLALLEQIAQAYPTEEPDRIKINVNGQKEFLHDAKIIKVKGQELSLRDIRENIVYKNWKNPLVFYGFYRGTIGSPKIYKRAYTPDRLDFLLEESAGEFVNSLRGFRKGSDRLYVSSLYQELQDHYFTDFDTELKTHLRKYARNEVLEHVSSARPFKYDTYQDDIADLTNGRRRGSSGNSLLGEGTIPREVRQFMTESTEKRRTLISKGLITPRGGYVIIEDLVPVEEQKKEIE